MAFHDRTATQVTHIQLNVKDLGHMTHFYHKTLGFPIISQDQNNTTFGIGDGGHTFTLHALTEGRQPSLLEAGLFHVAILLPTTTDLADFLYYAAQHGIRIGGGEHLVSEALYLNDPEGNGIEIYRDRPSNEWSWENNFVKMETLAVDTETLLQQRSSEGWQGIPSHAKLGHLHLKTHDLSEARQFYIDTLGFQHVSKYPNALFMSTNHYHHHIAVNTWQSNQPRKDNEASYGLAHIDIYKPGMTQKTVTAPEGFKVTIHSDETVVPE